MSVFSCKVDLSHILQSSLLTLILKTMTHKAYRKIRPLGRRYESNENIYKNLIHDIVENMKLEELEKVFSLTEKTQKNFTVFKAEIKIK